MSSSPITIKGYVTVLPDNLDGRQSRVAIEQDGVEYRVLPRGAGIDLSDEAGAMVEAQATSEEIDGVNYIAVRGYKVMEEDDWLDE